MNPLIVAGVVVRAYDGSLFCINDFHKAAGAQKKDQPSNFFDTKSTQEMASLLLDEKPGVEQNQVLKTVNGGDTQGTYVCKELVYAYAMWVSPVFALRVIRAFDEMVNQKLSPTVPLEKYNGLLGNYVNLQTDHIQLQKQLLSLPKPNVLKTGRWSLQEDQKVVELRRKGMGARTIARELNRTQDSIAYRFRILEQKYDTRMQQVNTDLFAEADYTLGTDFDNKYEAIQAEHHKNQSQHALKTGDFTLEEDDFILSRYRAGHAPADIARIMDRGIRQVDDRLGFLITDIAVQYS